MIFEVYAKKINDKSNLYFGWFVLIGVGLVQLVSNASGSLNLSMFIVPMSEELGFSRTLFSGAISMGATKIAQSDTQILELAPALAAPGATQRGAGIRAVRGRRGGPKRPTLTGGTGGTGRGLCPHTGA